MSKLDTLCSWFDEKPRVLVALSGGVDSALVAYAAHLKSPDSVALTANYQALPRHDLESARKTCEQIGIKHIIIQYDELENESYAVNNSERCFYCRTELGKRLQQEAAKISATIIVDGTHLDDMGDYRPGVEAMRAAGVRSPLVESGLSKADIRECAREVHLSTAERPANSCLSSRIPWGQRITAERLVRIELAEKIVQQNSGIGIVRVRDMGQGNARIEVLPDNIAKLESIKTVISSKLEAIGYTNVLVDPRGYLPGGANVNAN